jgi:hypothetical protein
LLRLPVLALRVGLRRHTGVEVGKWDFLGTP